MESSRAATLAGCSDSSTQKETKDINPTGLNDRPDAAKENADNATGNSKRPPEESDLTSAHGRERPTYTRMSRRFLSLEVLDKYKIDYILDANNPEFVLIKRWVPEYEQDFLWAATRKLRERLELEKNKMSQGLGVQPVQPVVEPEAVEVNPGKRGADLDLKINRIPLEKWLEFKGTDKRGKHVLDVAMRPCNAPLLVPASISIKTSENVDTSAEDIEAGSVPVRLAINSTHVTHELSRITNIGIRTGRNVIIPPWKLLVTHHDAIIQRFQTLKRLQNERDATKSSKENATSTRASGDDPGKKTSPDQDETKVTPESNDGALLKPCEICELVYPPHDTPLECLDIRISHLQCLVDFMDNDLKHVFELRRDLASGKTSEIAFEDLWHLFNPGDLIVSPTQRQAYRVFHTSGGRPLLSRGMNFEKRLVVTSFRLDCFYIDSEETRLGPVYEMISMTEYSGKRQITSLDAEFHRNRYFGRVPVFPVRFAENPKPLIEDLIKRGRRLHKFGTFAYKRYNGSAIEPMPYYEYPRIEEGNSLNLDSRRSSVGTVPVSQTPPFGSCELRLRGIGSVYDTTETVLIQSQFTSDIIIDMKREGKYLAMDWVDIEVDWRETAEGCAHYGASRYYDSRERIPAPECSCSDVVLDEAIDKSRAESYKEDLYLLNVMDPNDDITDERYMLLPSVIKAFVLKKQAWFNLSVDSIQDLDQEGVGSLEMRKQSGLDDLILPDGYFDLLEALIKAQPRFRIQKQFPNPRGGNGQGLNIFLHGGAGLGKTSTAECIAAYTQRPLYAISYNDISLAALGQERTLESHLSRALDWDCIVLIDDVDYFLGGSASASMVPSLCHALDNYGGIMILTAKHANFTSPAVLSRLHVSLHFPTFDQDSTIRVWQKNIDRVRTKELVDLDSEAEKAILAFAKAEYAKGRRWDGRQIRNCFQTAISIAEYTILKQHPDGEKGNEAKDSIPDRPSLDLKILETAAMATGKLG